MQSPHAEQMMTMKQSYDIPGTIIFDGQLALSPSSAGHCLQFGSSDEERISPILARLTAVVSIALWLGVGLAGRAIRFI